MNKFITKWFKQNWTIGQYMPSEEFKKTVNHSCVCLPTKDLVALTGPAYDEESQKLADLFSAAPQLYKVAHDLCLLRYKSSMMEPNESYLVDRKQFDKLLELVSDTLAKADGEFSPRDSEVVPRMRVPTSDGSGRGEEP